MIPGRQQLCVLLPELGGIAGRLPFARVLFWRGMRLAATARGSFVVLCLRF